MEGSLSFLPDAVQSFMREFDQVGYRYNRQDLFRMFLNDIMAGFGKKLQKGWEPEEFKIMRHLTSHYGRLVSEIDPYEDLLSAIYMEVGGNRHAGQFFTPPEICKLCAGVTFNESEFKEGSPVSIHDPAVGGGGMILGYLNDLIGRNDGYLKQVDVVGIDIDSRCCAMFAVQMAANALIHKLPIRSVQIYHGNTLGPLDELSLYWGYSINESPSNAKTGLSKASSCAA